jgi:NADPH:quinone reductase-like Zn-dependent oxidoreductase
MADLMTAVRVHAIGGPEVLRPELVPRPEPGPGEVLVEVHAAGVNPPDWYARSGFTLIPPQLRPVPVLPFTPGTDVSGVVAAVGPGVRRWRPGDAVFGLLRFPTTVGAARGYAEYTTAPEGDLAAKPAGLEHVRAAAVPMAGLTAWQFATEHAPVRGGETVLVNGAAGGVGHLLVQLAKRAGADVVAVASGRHAAFLQGLGVKRFVDYTTTAVAAEIHDVDLLFDTVGGPHAHRLVAALRDGGVLAPVFYGDYGDEQLARRGIRRQSGQVRSHGGQLAELAGLLAAGELRVELDSVHPLTDAPAAHARAEQGHLQGKIVLDVTGGRV